ncbi:MAG TPA: phosphoribosyl-ATP diphosphatase [Spirochaetales bacterium]|nr:phosphoribosyl-ATP diphosphatase [Spirochaetales bacterium]HRY53953.1 phosphoribosyl-ATP diphosphatase [Spirochaetia bacterium]HRZ64127.1 phosphoribosyl-ATP diphosphatase [Spirochaetia bacterium]
MIIPSIDIMGGQAVQLRGGRYPKLELGDPEALAARYSRAGEIAVVDLDAALGTGSNIELVERITRKYPCRVGGGIRSLETARRLLDAGARSVIVGTMAEPGFLSQLPRERVAAALDSRDGEVVVEGWTKGTGRGVEERMRELASCVSSFLVTFVEAEGSLGGIDLARARSLVAAAGAARVTFAGGASNAAEIAALDAAGADLQVGTALSTGKLGLAEAFAAPLSSERPDGLWPTLVCDEGGRALGLVWSDLESLRASFETGRGVYRSRSRGLWKKGESSGDTQDLVRVEADCDRDCLRFTVRQNGRGFCHRGTRSCFGEGSGIERLARTIESRAASAPAGSYTRRLLEDAALLGSKLREEADELARAKGSAEAAAEAADVLYFALAKAFTEGARLADIEAELDRRALKVTRRGGAPKPAFAASQEDLSWTGSH